VIGIVDISLLEYKVTPWYYCVIAWHKRPSVRIQTTWHHATMHRHHTTRITLS